MQGILTVAFPVFALPSAANSFVLAKEYDSFVEGASATILLSTVVSGSGINFAEVARIMAG